MGSRLQLHDVLKGIVPYVYFQAPSNDAMHYPCIVYERDSEFVAHADGGVYRKLKRYQVTVIDRDPDSELPDQVGDLKYCEFSRHFVADGLHHDVYNLFF